MWITGDVQVEGQTATLVATVNAQDRFNFDNGKQDAVTKIPDSDNVRFAEVGWAKPFDQSGSFSVTLSWEIGTATAPQTLNKDGESRNYFGRDRDDDRIYDRDECGDRFGCDLVP
jgi:hypothetical protein